MILEYYMVVDHNTSALSLRMLIEFITIASTGDSSDFGDLKQCIKTWQWITLFFTNKWNICRWWSIPPGGMEIQLILLRFNTKGDAKILVI